MAQLKEKAKKQAINIVEWILNLVILGLAADRSCVDCTDAVRDQLVVATIFGYFIVNSLVVINIFVEQEFDKIWRYIVAGMGALLFLVAGILVLLYIDKFGINDVKSADSDILTAIGALCLIMTVAYIIDIILIYKLG